ncbi:anti-sigma factor [Methylobrevis albus]|uniref:Anti-sigma factor n=1 Tax=Methylobrevis albus TaxID=2793297 RepID=A0A931MXN9_9HYPH|nr:anti-sigma factor [Methylobrevis albus]MBH0239408.1 anti-sigma factor [Methylobrevis albus]
MTDDERDLLAGEYVLGTLQGDVRAAVRRAMSIDPALKAAVAAWEARLAPLADLVPPVAPSPAVWAGIRRALDTPGTLDVVPTPTTGPIAGSGPAQDAGRPPRRTSDAARAEPRLGDEDPADPGNVVPLRISPRDRFDAPIDPPSPELAVDGPETKPSKRRGRGRGGDEPPRDPAVVRLERRVAFWRRATTGMGLIAAGLAGVVWLGSLPTPERPGSRFVAVVNAGGADPAMIVTVDTVAGTVAVRPVGAEQPANQSLELWYIPEGQAPRSLGLVEAGGPVQEIAFDRVGRAAAGATLAVSVEPPGGAPGGSPTGPVVYSGRLIPDQR